MNGSGAFVSEPLIAVAGIVPGSLFVLLDLPDGVHGTKLTDEDGFGFLIGFGGECHGSETMSMGLPMPKSAYSAAQWFLVGRVYRKGAKVAEERKV